VSKKSEPFYCHYKKETGTFCSGARMKRIEWRKFKGTVIGVDEVGRGCLAGPVYAAAVILNRELEDEMWTDSKTISAIRRTELSKQLHIDHKVSIAFATEREIEEINILQASFLAMKRAIQALNVTEKALVVVDGPYTIPGLEGYLQKAFVKGDSRLAPIAAASIAAKVERDRVMTELAIKYQGYGFENHKGYSTLEHKTAIQKLGPTEIHRRTFAGVAEYI